MWLEAESLVVVMVERTQRRHGHPGLPARLLADLQLHPLKLLCFLQVGVASARHLPAYLGNWS